jgi:hypothetical protein
VTYWYSCNIKNDSLNVPLKRIPAGLKITLHYVIAESGKLEPVECSACYAMEVRHEQLVEVGS